MIYLAANIFIYAVLNNDPKSKACLSILRKILKGEIEGGTSCLTWDEFQHALRRSLGREKAVEESDIFLLMSRLILFNVDRKVIEKAQSLTKEYSLGPRDAIHAATALLHNISELVSDDSDFDVVRELKRIKI